MINLQNIHNIQIIKKTQLRVPSFGGKKEENTGDVFVRSADIKEQPSVEEKPFEIESEKNDKHFREFVKFAEQYGLVDKVEKITSDYSNFIGEGFEGTTYSIPGSDDYIVKKYKRAHIVQFPVEKPTIEEYKDICPDLNIGQNIAVIKLPVSSSLSAIYYILQKQHGEKLGVEYQESKNINATNVKHHNHSLEQLAKSGTDTYTRLIRDIGYVSYSGYEFDYNNPNNFFFDKETSSVKFVDINDRLKDDTEQYERVLFALLDSNFHKHFKNAEGFEEEKKYAAKLSSEITTKFIDAMKSNGVQFADNETTDTVLSEIIPAGTIPGETLEDKKEYLRKNNLLKQADNID